MASHRIRVSLSDISQLFNSMDPSPFIEKDLDKDAEEFIVGWAHEYAHQDSLSLHIQLKQLPGGDNPRAMVEQAVRNYFAYRSKLDGLEFSRLMKQGRLSLAIGLLFLGGCLLVSEVLTARLSGAFASFVKEGLTIAGWVALWRPMEIYLYDWWPLRRRGRILEKLSHIDVELTKKD